MAKGQKFKKFTKDREVEFHEEVLAVDRVTRVVAGGRRLRFRATVIIGNKKGKVGLGIGKANEVMIAIEKAIAKAKKSLIIVPIVNDTITEQFSHKFKSAKILLMPAGKGTGIIAGGAIRKIAELAGITNLLSKSLGTTNKINNAKATMEAFAMLAARAKANNIVEKTEKRTAAKAEAAAAKGAPVTEKKEAPKPTAKAEAPKPAAKKPTAPAAKKVEEKKAE